MFNPSRKKNGDYLSPEIEVISLFSQDVITTSAPEKNDNIDKDGWT